MYCAVLPRGDLQGIQYECVRWWLMVMMTMMTVEWRSSVRTRVVLDGTWTEHSACTLELT